VPDPYVIAAGPLGTGTGTPAGSGLRVFPVTAPTQAGETLLAIFGSNNASIAVTGLTDGRGNRWTLDREYTTGPYTEFFRCDGPTGGPAGGPSVPLAAGDQLTLAGSPTITAQTGLLAVAVAGPSDPGQPYTFAFSATTLFVGVTGIVPALGGALVALNLNQGAGGVAAFDAPLTTLTSQAIGHQYAAGFLAGAPAQPVDVVARWPVAANGRLMVYAFLPALKPRPLRAWDGSHWRQVGAAGAKVWDGSQWEVVA
jgi:hypothetical protein